MAIKKIKVSSLPEATTYKGLYTLGLQVADTMDEFGDQTTTLDSVKVGLEFVKAAADNATEAATAANNATALATTATLNANAATESAIAATTDAHSATQAAAEATETATEVAANPTKIGQDYYAYIYNVQTKGYNKTDIYLKGADGNAATVSIGTVSTVAPNQPASITNTGTLKDAIFDFNIPKGVDAVTPIRGKDYWTQTDIDAINTASQTYIDQALSATNETVVNLIAKI